ncbi:hypothetical protein HU200_021849 [Digitaria exilis]|uniref:Protein TIFY n=1 Tax=Digitaria exilis TaxID=1010633 RepID=A0A835EYY1_9POAL|nr:hypothetical protein HU200_021849 [Digitaria exilis]
MPGTDVDAGEDPAQMTIVYGGRVLVLGDVPADKAAPGGATAEPTLRSGGHLISAADLPVARKASLQRFMEKRKGRVAVRPAGWQRRVPR